jgi:hypothetical protein
MPNDLTPFLIIFCALVFGAAVLGVMRWYRPVGRARRR